MALSRAVSKLGGGVVRFCAGGPRPADVTNHILLFISTVQTSPIALHLDEDDATMRIQEKGRSKSTRTIGIHSELAEAIQEYIQKTEIVSGPLFRARLNSRSEKLGIRPIGLTAMYELIHGYLRRLPRAMKTVELEDGTTVRRCI